MSNRDKTRAAWLSAIVLLIIYDVWAFLNSTQSDTLSAQALISARKHFTLPFLVGFLAGHLFWPRTSPIFGLSKKTTLFYIALPLVTVMVLVDALGLLDDVYMLPFMLPLGYPLGHWLWPQPPEGSKY